MKLFPLPSRHRSTLHTFPSSISLLLWNLESRQFPLEFFARSFVRSSRNRSRSGLSLSPLFGIESHSSHYSVHRKFAISIRRDRSMFFFDTLFASESHSRLSVCAHCSARVEQGALRDLEVLAELMIVPVRERRNDEHERRESFFRKERPTRFLEGLSIFIFFTASPSVCHMR